jgi:hypothetical protein
MARPSTPDFSTHPCVSMCGYTPSIMDRRISQIYDEHVTHKQVQFLHHRFVIPTVDPISSLNPILENPKHKFVIPTVDTVLENPKHKFVIPIVDTILENLKHKFVIPTIDTVLENPTHKLVIPTVDTVLEKPTHKLVFSTVDTVLEKPTYCAYSDTSNPSKFTKKNQTKSAVPKVIRKKSIKKSIIAKKRERTSTGTFVKCKS